MSHTVEKIGGTSMMKVQDVLHNIFLGDRDHDEIYNRIFVVSAYAGMTDMLLEHKHTGRSGVFALYSDGDHEWSWHEALTRVSERMCEVNHEIFGEDTDRDVADRVILDRIEGVRSCLIDLQRLCSFGHFRIEQSLETVREMLASLGEVHSAHNTALLLRRHGVQATFVDLSGWREQEEFTLEEKIRQKILSIDLSKELPIITGYAKCKEGLMKTYDRGYTEITFSRIASITGSREAIIHKEYHLSSADPKIVGADTAVPIGRTNYDVADQLSNLGMEAVHPGAAQSLRRASIPLRVKNTFEPDHLGTLIDGDYRSEEPCVEIVAGRRGVFALEVFDHDMVDKRGHDLTVQTVLDKNRAKILTRESNANTITHYLATTLKTVKKIVAELENAFPAAEISMRRVAFVCAIGSDMDVPGLLSKCVTALAKSRINILAIHQAIRSVDIKFVVDEQDYQATIASLHDCVVKQRGKDTLVPRVA